jgi:hypothetical protein
MTHTAIRIGPDDHGRRMTLDDFDEAEVVEGCLVELGRGVVIVSEVPLPWHLILIDRLLPGFRLRITELFGGL